MFQPQFKSTFEQKQRKEKVIFEHVKKHLNYNASCQINIKRVTVIFIWQSRISFLSKDTEQNKYSENDKLMLDPYLSGEIFEQIKLSKGGQYMISSFINTIVYKLITIKLPMSTNDNTLMTFLKKQSLFGNSPSKKRSSRSRSKDKYYDIKPAVNKPYEDNLNQNLFNTPDYNAYPDRTATKSWKEETGHREGSPIQNVKVGFNPQFENSGYNSFNSYDGRNDYREGKVTSLRFDMDGSPGKVRNELVANDSSFQSARVESFHFLESMEKKLRDEIENINAKIGNFHKRMQTVISGQFKNLKDRIYYLIEEAYRESGTYIAEYMKLQEEKYAIDLIRMREQLKKEVDKVQILKDEVAKPNWRKTTGQIIANELELKTNQITKRSMTLEVGKWELGDFSGFRLKDLQKSLRDVFKLKRDT